MDDYQHVEKHVCPVSSCTAPSGSPCRTIKGKVAIRYHTARFRLVPSLTKVPNVPTAAARKPSSTQVKLPRPAGPGAEPTGHIRIGYARASTAEQSLDTQLDSLATNGITQVFSDKVSTRVAKRPGLEKAVAVARELRTTGARVTLVVHEPKRLGRGIELVNLAEDLKGADVGLQFLQGELQGSHDPSGVVFGVLAALSGMEREYIRDATLAGHKSARRRGKTIGGASVTSGDMLARALQLRAQGKSLRDIAGSLVISSGAKKGQHPSAVTVLRMLREYDDKTDEAALAKTEGGG
ncbi:recombinase family protein (plasmid) [Streptomyces sp. NBC_01298]|uniref:recombinase family protein n=1 Tax=Streptomyces sp. NBC_01298 TaxID=2903817 RepID=UPI002E132C9A|nr:recombinase family protein [Streptomyces sp. NBC_01298]